MAIAVDPGRKVLDLSRDPNRPGEIMRDDGTLNEQNLKRVLTAQRGHGECFGDVAVRLGLITEMEVRRTLAKQCELPIALLGNPIFSSLLSTVHRPQGSRAEAIRNLRSELLLRWFSHGNQMLTIGEVCSDHGAGTLAADLACSFAQLGRRTILIDADLRNPQQHSLFKLEYQFGLADFLKGRCNPGDLLNSIPGLGHLSVIFSGEPPLNPQELLSLASLNYLFESIRKAFDVAIVVGPPLSQCADMQVIATRAEGCILSTRRHQTQLADIEFAKTQLASTPSVLLGVVLEG